MFAKLFLELTDYSFFRRIIWKPLYEILAKIKIANWHYMNYGYMPFSYEATLTLNAEDEINRYPLQLYYYLARKVEISQKEILDIGCGRGGGAHCISKYLKPKKTTGLDIAYNAVKFAKETHFSEGLQFIQGNAENIPFQCESFDVVINVESCHAYGSVPNFLKEVIRVLRPGGYFLCTDMRSPGGMQTLKNNLLATEMHLVMEEDITTNIINAIELEDEIKHKRISEDIPKWLGKLFKEFAGVKGSQIHKDLQNRSLVYHRFVLRKTF